MPYSDQPGRERDVTATKAVNHGVLCVENGIPGVAHKVQQLGTFVDPASAAAKQIAIGEVFVQRFLGIAEADRSGNLAAADVGDDIYIHDTDNALGLAAQGLTTGALTANWHKVGKVIERDATRTPQVLRISLDLVSHVAGTGV